MSKIITAGEDFHIQPSDINAQEHFFDAFGNSETEISAGWIVQFLQERGQGWKPFTYEDINSFYARKYSNGFHFNRLVEAEMVPPSLARAFAGHHDPLVPVGGGWIVLDNEGKYYVTDEFITRCHKSRPAN